VTAVHVLTGLTQRRKHILTGAISAVVLVALISIGIKAAFGAFAGGFEVAASFDAAGQGLSSGADVKVRGVNVGEVRRVELVDGRAEVTMRMFPGERIPRSAAAEIRPKTLFGEKFVHLDLGPDEGGDDILADGDRIEDTRGGFELEQVLSDTFPLLQEIEPTTVALVLRELSDAGAGLGETVNRTIANSAVLAELQADNLDNATRFLTDLADLSEMLAERADTLLAGARDLNSALPVLIDGEADLVELLEQVSRLSNDASDLILANRGFLRAANVDGSRALDILFERRDQVVPLVVGLRQYVEALTRVARIEIGDGTVMAAVKGFMGSDACELLPCNPGLLDDGGSDGGLDDLLGPILPAGDPEPAPPGPLVVPGGEAPAPTVPTVPSAPEVPGTSSDDDSGLRDLFGGVLGG
jgi:phospholipid/cholesterol/gamma-HCH transport system substrate-binding protein